MSRFSHTYARLKSTIRVQNAISTLHQPTTTLVNLNWLLSTTRRVLSWMMETLTLTCASAKLKSS